MNYLQFVEKENAKVEVGWILEVPDDLSRDDVLKAIRIGSRPKGKWIGGTTDCFQCSNCSKLSFYPSYVKVTEVEWDYCPYCGAEMENE